jgi:chaperone required for assembly of F1-ATPase
MLCSLFKSTSISIMLLHNVITVEEAIQKSMIEENYQISKFGFVYFH